jgi:PAS domain S-box-containing protein
MPDEPIEPSVDLPSLPFRDLVEHLPVVVYVDSDDEVPRSLYVSPNVEDILGYSPSVYLSLGESWVEFIHPDDRPIVEDTWVAARRAGSVFEWEYRFIHPDGHVVWVRDHALRFTSPSGTRYWQGVLQDITAEREAERGRDESIANYQALLENLPAVVYEMDPDDDRATRFVNRKIQDLLGYTQEEWLEQPDIWAEVLHPDDREVELAAHDLHSATGDPWKREYRVIAADGRVVWVRDQATLLRDADGHPRRWQGVMIDITTEREAAANLHRARDELEFRVRARTAALEDTNALMAMEIGERQRVEEELTRTQHRLEHLLANVPAVLYTWQPREADDGADLAWVSPQIERMLGYTPAEWHESWAMWKSRVHPHDAERVIALAERSMATGEPFEAEYRYLAKDGRIVWVYDRATLARRNDEGYPLLFDAVMVDITEAREAQHRALEAEERFRQLVEDGPIVTYTIEQPNGDRTSLRISYMSPQIQNVIGYPFSYWADEPMRWFALIHPDDQGWMLQRAEEILATGAPYDLTYRMIAADGSVVAVRDWGGCVERNEHGQPTKVIGSIVDVTRDRERLDRLETERAMLRDLVEGVPAVPWVEYVDPQTHSWRYVYIGPQAAAVFGYSAEELMLEREHFPRLVLDEDLPLVQAADDESERTGIFDARYRVVRKDGRVILVHSTARRISEAGQAPEIWVGIASEVAEPRAAERPPTVSSATTSPAT